MPAPRTCLVISDGRRGIENQALGLAESLSEFFPDLNIARHTLKHGRFFTALPAHLQFFLRPNLKHYGITDNNPAMAIGCGRQAIAPLLALNKAGGAGVFTVYVQDPRMSANAFDVVIAPEHDGLTGDNIIPMIGSPNRISAQQLKQAERHFAAQISLLRKPRVAMLIGGKSKSHRLDKASHAVHICALKQVLDQGGSVMLTTSRRTTGWACADYQKMAKDNANIWLWDAQSSTGDNPYFAFLGAADFVLVTEDSTNMLTEACATGKPVFTLPMSGKAGKFNKLYASLATRCYISPFKGSLEGKAYNPLDETKRVAARLATRISAK